MKNAMWISTALAGVVGMGLVSGCSTAPKDEGDKTALQAQSSAALTSFQAKDSSLKPLMDKAVAWAIFPDIGKAGFIVGGSYGRGDVFEGGKRVGYASISQASFGLQAGAQTFQQLVLFMRPEDFAKFKQGDFSLEGNASAVALKAGAAGTTDPSKGVIVFVDTKGGLMAEAAIAGQHLKYEPLTK